MAVRVRPKSPSPQPLPSRSLRPILESLPSPFPNPIDQLIEQAEDLYSAGLDEYRAGNLENAKERFNQSLALLLESKFDIEASDRLRTEFDKLVENIHGIEQSSLERGDALAERRYEPAPIESLANLTFPVDPNVNKRVQQEVKSVRSDLPLVSNDLVAGVINYFQSNPRGQEFIRKILQRVNVYQSIISEALRKENLPQDLIYVAGAESAYNPLALSRAGAKGVWQFMLGTGMLYGLKKNRWVDEREDPVKSTQAAVQHLKNLYQTFGDWYLAMAAYDSGSINIQRAIERTGYADFWTLRKLHALPTETENYVPIILATALIAKDPKSYGFALVPEAPFASDPVVVSVPTDLRLVAQLIDRPVDELVRLNPSLLRWTTPANDSTFILNLPQGTKEAYERGIALVPSDKRIWWRVHKAAEGETVLSVARKYHLSRASLAGANKLGTEAHVETGSRLLIPLPPKSEATLVRVHERGTRRAIRYRIKPGDTLELIADRFDVTPYQIRRWNNLKSSQLVAGRPLRLYVVGTRSVGYRHGRIRRRPTIATPPNQKNVMPSASPATPGASPAPPPAMATR